eukprot:gene12929-27274_t
MNPTEVRDAVFTIKTAAGSVGKAVNFADKGNIAAARDSCVQACALLELIIAKYGSLDRYLGVCLKSLQYNINDLTQEQNIILPLNTEIKPTNSGNNDQILHSTREIYFDDIIGSDFAKQALHENVILPLTIDKNLRNKIFNGIRGATGNCLLFGPPGTGKTCLVQAAACEAKATLFSIRPSDVLSKYHGESERYLSGVFEKARQTKKAIIFFDEFDSIATARGGSDDSGQHRRLLAELLLQLTYNKQHTSTSSSTSSSMCSVIVLAATNRIEDLDEAIIRRFDAKIYVGVPDIASREELLDHYMTGIDMTLNEAEIRELASKTAGWSGAEIEHSN